MSDATVAVIDRDELNTVIDFNELYSRAEAEGSLDVFIASPYKVLDADGKRTLLNKPFMIRAATLSLDKETQSEYVVLHIVTKDNELVLITDGSTGIKEQIKKRVAERIADKHPKPAQDILVPNGLRVSDYLYEDEKTGKKTPASTFYLA